MDMPQETKIVHDEIDAFWSRKVEAITSSDELACFMRDYISLLGNDYGTSVAQALLRIGRIKKESLQPEIIEITCLANKITTEPNIQKRQKLWQKIAELANFTEPLPSHILITISSYEDSIHYLKNLLANVELWPQHEIAYKIVNIAAHYNDICHSDNPLYNIWNLATGLEIMPPGTDEFITKWQLLLKMINQATGN